MDFERRRQGGRWASEVTVGVNHGSFEAIVRSILALICFLML